MTPPPDRTPLQLLLANANAGDTDQVRQVLLQHPEIASDLGNLPGHTGKRSALHFAVASQNAAMVSLLLQFGAHPNVRDEGDDATALHFAAEKNDLEIVRLLLAHGADAVGAGTFHRLNVLGWATVFGNADPAVVELLLASGAVHEMPSAVATGDVAAVRDIAAHMPATIDARLDSANKQRTPLHLAVVKRQRAALSALLELGADRDATDAAALTALDVAALNGETEMVSELLRFNATVTMPAAVVLGRADEVKHMLRENPALLLPGNLYGSLLAQAAERASGDVIDLLVKHGANVNAPAGTDVAVDSAIGYTPLHAAAFFGNMSATRALLNHGASVRAREQQYCATPAGWARYAGHAEVAAVIAEGDIDIFDAIDAGLANRIDALASADPGALTRPMNAYVKCTSTARTPKGFGLTTPLMHARAGANVDVIEAIEALLPHQSQLVQNEMVTRFLRGACLDWRSGGGGQLQMAQGTATRLLKQHPEIGDENIFTAVASGDVERVKELLAINPALAVEFGGPRHWTPLLYLATARLNHSPSIDNAVDIARLLLECGADANASYPGGSDDIRYTVATCVMGMGENAFPLHPRARELLALLFERGAEPYDPQLLYNVFANHAGRRLLSDDLVWVLELIHLHSIKRARAPHWEDADWNMLNVGGYGPGAYFLLSAAASVGNLRMVEWMLAHNANPNVEPARTREGVRSPIETAANSGHSSVVELLVRHGAVRSEREAQGYEKFVLACSELDGVQCASMLAVHPEYLDNPFAMFDAVRNDQADVVTLLLELGMSPNISDSALGNRRALHVAANAGSVRAAAVLLAHGADADAVEQTYGATPMGAASWSGQSGMIALLGKYSRDMFNLTFAGNSKRVAELLQGNRALAKSINANQESLLMWLPEDEEVAIALARLLLVCGADVSWHDARGMTALRVAERRAMAGVAEILREAEGLVARD